MLMAIITHGRKKYSEAGHLNDRRNPAQMSFYHKQENKPDYIQEWIKNRRKHRLLAKKNDQSGSEAQHREFYEPDYAKRYYPTSSFWKKLLIEGIGF